jgi:hypothetical protein
MLMYDTNIHNQFLISELENEILFYLLNLMVWKLN